MFTKADHKAHHTSNTPQIQGMRPSFGQRVPQQQFITPSKDQGISGVSHDSFIQPQLTISQPGDPYEKEADATADKVMRMSDTQVQLSTKDEELHRQIDAENSTTLPEVQMKEVEEEIQLEEDMEMVQSHISEHQLIYRQEDKKEEEKTLQRSTPTSHMSRASMQRLTPLIGNTILPRGINTQSRTRTQSIHRYGRAPPIVQPSFEQSLQATKGGGNPLDSHVHAFMGTRFGADFSAVRIHAYPTAASLSASIGAHAFAHGRDIYFNTGKYNPGSETGKHLLAHELTHTIQQGASPSINPFLSTKSGSMQRSLPVPTSISNTATNNDLKGEEEQQLMPSRDLTSIQLASEDPQQEEKEEPIAQPQLILQKSSAEGASFDLEEIQRSAFTAPLTVPSSSALTIQRQEIASVENDTLSVPEQLQSRGPPVFQRVAEEGLVQCSLFDTALANVSELLDDIPLTLDIDVALAWLLGKLRQFASYIPGYSALALVLGRDPITGDRVERNGRNFIDAGLDIIPGGGLLRQKLDELGALDQAAQWIDTQMEVLGNAVQTVSGEFSSAWNSLGVSSILDGPTTILRNFGAIFERGINQLIAFAERAAGEMLDIVKDFLLTQVVDFIKEHTNAYELLKVIIGRDPITDETVERNGTNILNALLEMGGEEGREQRRQMEETGSFQKAADWIDRGIAVFGNLYQSIRDNFGLIWNSISIDALMHPIDTFQSIYETFATPVGDVLAFVADALVVILGFIKEVLMQRLSAWAREQRGYELVTVIIGKDPFTDEVVPRNVENIIRGFMSLMEGGREQFQQLQESGAIAQTTARINAAVETLNMTPVYIVQLFTELWNSFSFNDLSDPIAAFTRIIDRFGEPIGRLVAFVIEIVKIVIMTILQVMNFPFDLINNIITRSMAAFERIKQDPVAFLKNLLRAIKQGFIQFFDNIVTHLMNGVIGWLMSELRDANVPEPQDFSLRGIISWVLEVLGISMEAVWEKLAQHPRIGPERVARIRSMINTLEGIWTFIRDVQERGMAAIWERIQEQLSNLWETVLNAVKNWIMERIINQVTARLLSMLDPTGIMAVVNSAIAIFNAIQSFIRYLREMLEVVNSFVNGVADIAEGNVTTAANYLERTMGRAMPIVIGFLANQVGLSGIGRRIGEMIMAAREMVDRGMTWLVNRAVNTAMNVIDRLMAMGRSAVGAVMGWFGLRQEFTAADGEHHSLYMQGNENNANLYVASANPRLVAEFLTNITSVVNTSGNPAQRAALTAAVPLSNRISALRISLAQRNNPHRDTEQTELDNKMTLLTPHLSVLMAIASVPEPPILVKPPFANGVKASSFEVEYLKIDRTEGGSDASSNSGTSLMGWPALRTAGLTANAAWVKMHLLTEQLGGPALDSNLTPARGQEANLVFYRDLEQHAIQDVSRNYVIWYKVTIGYHSGTNADYPNRVKMEYGPYNYENNAWVKKTEGATAKNMNDVPATIGRHKELTSPALDIPNATPPSGPPSINTMSREVIRAMFAGVPNVDRIFDVRNRLITREYRDLPHMYLRLREAYASDPLFESTYWPSISRKFNFENAFVF